MKNSEYNVIKISENNQDKIFIKKKDKPKDAVRINSEADIPEFLKDTIKIEDGEIVCLAAEGYNHSPLGSVIGFDRNAPTETGKGAWPLGSSSYVERDGVFYPACDIRTAVPITPPYSIETKYGTQVLNPGERGYLVTSSKGSQNILTMETTSANDYMVCTEDGQEIESLRNYDKNLMKQQWVSNKRGIAKDAGAPVLDDLEDLRNDIKTANNTLE